MQTTILFGESFTDTYPFAHVVITSSVHVMLGPGEELLVSHGVLGLLSAKELRL